MIILSFISLRPQLVPDMFKITTVLMKLYALYILQDTSPSETTACVNCGSKSFLILQIFVKHSFILGPFLKMADGHSATFDEGMAAFTLAIVIVLARNGSILVNGGEFTIQIVASNINNLNTNTFEDLYVESAYLGHTIQSFGVTKYCIALGWKSISRERSSTLMIPAIGEFIETSRRVIIVPNHHSMYTMSIDLKSINPDHEKYGKLIGKVEVVKNKLLGVLLQSLEIHSLLYHSYVTLEMWETSY
jgi:hypothetical protein